MRNADLFRPIIISLFLCFVGMRAEAGVTPNGLGSKVSHSGFDFSISGGTQRGGNLFQSFSDFNLVKDESATFAGPNSVQNILARVTGGPSSIDGTIKSDIQGANLFFLNPAGVMFGQNAHINVSGSFAVSTANYLKLVDGGKFNTSLGGGDVLTSAPVSAFGFLNAAPAPVSIANATLRVAPGKSFSVVAGDITLDGTQLSVPGGNASLFSARASGEVAYDPSDSGAHFRESSLSAFGNITLKGAATVAIDSPDGGGKVTMRGGRLVVTESSTISSINQGANPGGDIELTADSLTVLKGGRIEAEVMSGGAGGNLSVQSTDIAVDGDDGSRYSDIRSTAESGSGDAGKLVLNTTNLTLSNGAAISGSSLSEGRGADVSITASTIDIFGFTAAFGDSGIFANAVGAGNGGDIHIDVKQAFTVSAGGQIQADAFSSGNAGNLSIRAGSLLIDGGDIEAVSNLGASGDGGNLTISVDHTFTDGGEIFVFTFSNGKSGDLNVSADAIVVDGDLSTGTGGSGRSGNESLTANSILIQGGGVSSHTQGSGKGGDLSLTASSIVIQQGVVDAGTIGTGDAGAVTMTGNSIVIRDNSLVDTETDFSTGNGGAITLTANSILVDTGAQVTAATDGPGNGGQVTMTANSLVIQGWTLSSTQPLLVRVRRTAVAMRVK